MACNSSAEKSIGMEVLRSNQPQARSTDFVYHQAQSHAEEAFKCLNNLRSKHQLCDVVLVIGEVRIHAHRVILASFCPYFFAMFTSDFPESHQSEITMQDVDPSAMKLLIDFGYTAKIHITEENVQTLLPAACLLQLNSVRDACCEFLKSQLDPTNCLGIRSFADRHTCQELLEASHRFALQHFVDVSKTEEFMILPLEQVVELVSNDELNVQSEEQVYMAAITWIKFDAVLRKQFIPQLLPLVRLPLLTKDCLMNCVETEELIKNCPECKDLLIEAMKFHLLPEQRSTLQSPRTQSRQPTDRVPILFAIGGGSLFAIHSECECYDPRFDRWCMVTPMSTRRARLGVGVVSGKLIAVGGYDGSTDLNSVEVYCPQSNLWSHLPSMGTRRSCLGLAIVSGLVYAIGGYDGASCLCSVERYDPLTSQWTSVSAMNTRRRYVRVGVINGNIYAVGGYDGSSHLNTVECYDPVSNTWKCVANMTNRRSSAGVAILQDTLYVIGGNDGASCLNTVERYTPATNTWQTLAPMIVRRSTHDVGVTGSFIYAVGGNDGSSSLNSCEKYDPEKNQWTSIVVMSTRRSSVGVAVVDVLLL